MTSSIMASWSRLGVTLTGLLVLSGFFLHACQSPESDQDDRVKGDSVKTDSTKNDTVKQDTVKTDTTKPDTTKPDTVKTCKDGTAAVILKIKSTSGVIGLVTIKGPGGFTRQLLMSDSLKGLAPGDYSITTQHAKMTGSITAMAYYGRVSQSAFALPSCGRQNIQVDYIQEPGSGRMYVISGSSIVAFAGQDLSDTATLVPANVLKTPADPKALAFDAQGNLWFSSAEGVFMYAMEDLAKPDAQYRIQLTGPGVMGDAVPGAGPLAFDQAGGLIIGQTGSGRIVRLRPDQLMTSGQPTIRDAKMIGTSVKGVQAMAFDIEGNLWLANSENQIVKFSKPSWSGADMTTPSMTIVYRSAPPAAKVYTHPKAMAFTPNGELWIGYSGNNDLVISSPPIEVLSDTLEPYRVRNASGLALMDALAFDGRGALWLPGKSGELLHIDVDDMRLPGDLKPTMVFKSASIENVTAIALNPPPSRLPFAE
jgi:streptogramin lyase